MFSFFIVLLTTILFSFLPERMLKPNTPQLNFSKIIQQSLLITFFFLLLTLIVQRAVFSALAISIFLIILIAVSNAKYKALKEPMVFSDFAMFSQAFKHPRLYFPFLGLLPVIIAPILIVALIITVLKLEPALPFTWQRIMATLISMLGIAYAIKQFSLSLNLTGNPEEDNQQFGLINALTAYTLQAQTKSHKEQIKQALASSPFSVDSNKHKSTHPPFSAFLSFPANNKPNITVIQSESFFDARRLHPAIKKSILKNFDAVNAESLQYGKLEVPAWGANTMRTEFSFLTGLANDTLAYYRYYPYQFMANYPVSSLASILQKEGYHCICIHPHPASFFGRDKIFPKIGFDEFIDIEKFQNKETFGPYISDKTVSQKILEITQEKTDKPLFIFVITMENHGPLHLEKITNDEHQKYYSEVSAQKLPKPLNDLSVYLRHLKNADNMIKTLTESYQKSEKETLLCFYGDHVPSMPNIYQATGYTDNHSDYFIWSSAHRNAESTENAKNSENIDVKNLGIQILKSYSDVQSTTQEHQPR